MLFCAVSSRIKQMVDQRRALIEERRKASIATKLQKEAISKMMEEVRSNASKANKLIKSAMSGNMSVDKLLSTSPSKSSRSRSAGRRSKTAKGEHSSSQSMENNGAPALTYSTTMNRTAPELYVSPYAVTA